VLNQDTIPSLSLSKTFGLSNDLPRSVITLAIAITVIGFVLLFLEIRWRERKVSWLVPLTGFLAASLALLALLRPVNIVSRGSTIGPKVLVLVDHSRSMLLNGDDGKRHTIAKDAVERFQKASKQARISVQTFGNGIPQTYVSDSLPNQYRSDLSRALQEIATHPEEPPNAMVVVSDGRWDSPSLEHIPDELRGLFGNRNIPISTVAVARRDPKDATIRAVNMAGAAIAHQAMRVTIEVGCTGGLSCDGLTVAIKELLENAPPALLASGIAKVKDGSALLELNITLDRAGPRLIQVAIEAPEGDEVPENNVRHVALDVARDRVRVLHVAGRPTYDVRALRMWLKSNASVDVIAFFILRSEHDNVMALDQELALIRFPVRELFTEHLPSFDAVILQDFNAVPYNLLNYLPNLAHYVGTGGGLVMVGGPDAFLGGGYRNSPLEQVLPINLKDAGDSPFDLGNFVPRPTLAGKVAPMLAPLRSLFGDELPTMPGVNIVGSPKPGALVLWEHPARTLQGQTTAMPVLTLGEYGDGRAVALAVDGAHRLGFSEFAARVAGRGHGALWDGLLGWLMRDPRFEPAQVSLAQECHADEPMKLIVTPLPGMKGPIEVEVTAAGTSEQGKKTKVEIPARGGPVEVPIGTLKTGGYIAKIQVGSGSKTRRAFACEKGGPEWADPRPDTDRLQALAKASQGTFVYANDIEKIGLPPSTQINAERTVTPFVPPWVWTLSAALALGLHWIVRRKDGLA
jgi:uncharacterized membrane protein